MNVNELATKSGFEWVVNADPEKTVSNGYVGDLLSWVMSKAKANDCWITIMSNVNIVAVASLTEVACIVLADGVDVDDTVKATALEHGVNILKTDLPTYEAAKVISEIL